MGWRKMMRVETANLNSTPKSNIRNMSDIQENDPVKPNITDITNITPMVQKLKTNQQKHDALWKKAWVLADWIDDSSSTIPWQERIFRVPELQAMSIELGQIEKMMQDELLPLIPFDKNSIEETQTNLRLQSDFLKGFSPLAQVAQGKQYTLKNCPARCRQSGVCYGKAFFDGKPGMNRECISRQCHWSDRLSQ